MSRRLPSILAALALGGCAINEVPRFYTAPADTLAGPERTAALLAEAQLAQAEYDKRFASAARRADLSNLPLIGAAAATAALLFGKADKDAVFAVGLGTGTYVAARGLLAPPALATLYLQGRAALGCVRRQGPLFAGPAGGATSAAFLAALAELRAAVGRAELAALAPPPTGDASAIAMFQALQLRLRDQIAAGRALETAAERELVAYASAPEVFETSIAEIEFRVVSKGREGRNIDPTALTATLLAAGMASLPKTAAPVTAEPPMSGVSAEPASATDDAVAALRALTAASAALRQSTPSYTTALAKVALCPNEVRGA